MAILSLGIAVIGGGGFIEARNIAAAPVQRSVKSDNLMEMYARQAHEAMLLKKAPLKSPARASEQEVIFEEDFSRIKGGSETEPGDEIGTYTQDGNSFWPDDVTNIPGWWGIGTYAMDEAVGLCYPGVGGVVCTGPANMYGNLHISFRAKAREGNREGARCTFMVSIVAGDPYNPVPTCPELAIPVTLKVEDGWQNVEVDMRNPNRLDDSRLQINAMTYSAAGFIIDDIKITRDFDFCLPPTELSCGYFTDDGFTIIWNQGAENNYYEFSMMQEKKLSEPFDATESFDGALPQYWSTTGSTVATGGADNSSSLRLTNGQELKLAFGGGRLGSLSAFFNGENFDKSSEAVLKMIAVFDDGHEEELGTLAVPRVKEGGETVDLRSAINNHYYQLTAFRFVADGFTADQCCYIDNVQYIASPACEKTQVMADKIVNDTQIVLTGLDPENEYYVGVRGVKNEQLKSDFLGYYYVPGMPAPKALEATDIEKRGAYTANWTPSPKAKSYTVNNFKVDPVTEDKENYVVLRDDFEKANSAAQEYPEGLYLDDWTDCKGWHTDMLPDGFMTSLVADGGYIGALNLPLYTPQVSLDNDGGKFTVRFKVKAFGGEIIRVYSGDEMQVYDFSEVNPEGDPYAFEEHEVEMHFNNGAELQSLVIMSTVSTFMIDWFEITQNVKAGDRVIRYLDHADVTGHDSAEYRFSGLENAEGVKFGYNVSAYGEYMGQTFNSQPSNLVMVDLNQTGLGSLGSDDNSVSVSTVAGGVMVTTSEPAVTDIYSLSGVCVASADCGAGATLISLPAGVYVVRVAGHSYKAVVR